MARYTFGIGIVAVLALVSSCSAPGDIQSATVSTSVWSGTGDSRQLVALGSLDGLAGPT